MIELIFTGSLISFCLLAAGSIIITTLRNGISPMPTSYKVKRDLLKLIPPETKGKVFELGSAWGTLAFPLAKALPNCQVNAYENSFFPYLFSVLRKAFFPLSNLLFHYQNFHGIPLKEAKLITCYLFPGGMEILKEKMERELTKGCVVISHTFVVPGWKPKEIIEVDDLYKTKIYLYHFENTTGVK